MEKTVWYQKIFLCLGGLLLGMVMLEASLRVAGFLYTLKQESTNRVSWQENEIRILCLGESTTAMGGENSYPAQLEEVLNQKGLKAQFTVINKGQVAKGTAEILSQLEDNLRTFNPHIVVTLLGINEILGYDHFKNSILSRNNFWTNLRIYKLIKYINLHASNKFKLKGKEAKGAESLILDEDFAEMDRQLGGDDDYVATDEEKGIIRQLAVTQQLYEEFAMIRGRVTRKEEIRQFDLKLEQLKEREGWLVFRLGRFHHIRENYALAQRYLSLGARQFPNHFAIYLELGRLFRSQNKFFEAIAVIKKAIQLNPETFLAYMELARIYSEMGNEKDAYRVYQIVFERKPDRHWVYPEIGSWFFEHNYDREAEEVFLYALKIKPRHNIYDRLGDIYQKRGDPSKAQAYYQKASKYRERLLTYPPITAANYNKIADILQAQGIPHISMQYPLKDLDPLKDILAKQNQVIFVENKTIFEEVLKQGSYEEYFTDIFADDFGHCTRLGNNLIARNLAEKIVKLIENINTN